MKLSGGRTPLALMLVLALLVALPAAAQDLSEEFSFASGSTFSYPAGSEIENIADLQARFEANEGATVIVSDQALFEAASLDANAGPEELLDWYIENTSNREISVLVFMTSEIVTATRN